MDDVTALIKWINQNMQSTREALLSEVYRRGRSSWFELWCAGVGARERKKRRERKGKEGKGRERKGKEGKGRERKGKEGKGRERKGKEEREERKEMNGKRSRLEIRDCERLFRPSSIQVCRSCLCNGNRRVSSSFQDCPSRKRSGSVKFRGAWSTSWEAFSLYLSFSCIIKFFWLSVVREIL